MTAAAFVPCVGCPPGADCADLGEGCGAHWDSWRAWARTEHMRGLAEKHPCGYCRAPVGVACRNRETGEPLGRTAAHQVRLAAAGLGEAEL